MTSPQWTALFTDDRRKGEDHLGLEGAAQGYQQYLIPGVITTTDRARYYSFYSWVLHRFIYGENSSRLLADFRGSYFKRHGVAFILGCYSHHKDSGGIAGLVGGGTNNSKARRMWESGNPCSLDVNYFGNSLGGFGQYYRTAMRAMGLVRDAERARWVYRLTKRGQALAEAFEASIQNTTYYSTLREQEQLTTLSREDALEYGSHCCLCTEALERSLDRELLLDAFFRFDRDAGERDPHARRRLTLGLILDLASKAGKTSLQQTLRPAIYLGEYSPDHAYEPAGPLANWYSRWKLVQTRHTYSSAIQLLWSVFLNRLRDSQGQGLTFTEFIDWVAPQSSPEGETNPVSEYLNQLCIAVGLEGEWQENHPNFDLACKQSTTIDEYTLFMNVRRESENPGVLINSALRILCQLFLRFYKAHQSNDPIWLEMAKRPRLPIGQFFDDMRHRLSTSDWTIREFLKWLYREYILGQHEFIALEKLRHQGYDTFKFYYQDDMFKWPYGSDYSEPLRYPTLRLFNGLSILIDLGLIQDQDDICNLTDDGKLYLARVLEITDGD